MTAKVDVAIATNATPPSQSLNAEPYRKEPLTAFAAVNQSLAQSLRLGTGERGAIPLILRVRRNGQSNAEDLLNALRMTRIKFRVVMRCESAESVKELVRAGAGIGILYNDLIKREIDEGKFRPVTIDGFHATRQTYVLYSKHKPLSSLAREFLSLLQTGAKKELRVESGQQVSSGQSKVTRLDALQLKLAWWVAPMTGLLAVAYDYAA